MACSYGYKLVSVDDKSSKRCKSYLGEDALCNFMNSMIEESKFYTDIMEKLFNKILKKMMKILKTHLLRVTLKQKIIVISLEDIEALHTEIVILMLN